MVRGERPVAGRILLAVVEDVLCVGSGVLLRHTVPPDVPIFERLARESGILYATRHLDQTIFEA